MVLITTLCSCAGSDSSDENDVVVRIGEETLSRSMVLSLMPKGLSSADSLLYAESIQTKWIKDELVYDMALRNLDPDEKSAIDALVNDYRRSLVRNSYQEKLVKEKLETNVTDEEKVSYYEENKDEFVLDNPIIKGVFLKIPSDAPGLDNVRKWYKSVDESAIEKIEKYSVQNAIFYEYFPDKWFDFNDVFDNMPIHVSNPNEYLRAHNQVELSDSSFCYFLNVTDYIMSGNMAPLEYVEPKIVEKIVNKKKVDYLVDFENDLYKNAINKGDVKLKTKP
jgi:hypothetical protein